MLKSSTLKYYQQKGVQYYACFFCWCCWNLNTLFFSNIKKGEKMFVAEEGCIKALVHMATFHSFSCIFSLLYHLFLFRWTTLSSDVPLRRQNWKRIFRMLKYNATKYTLPCRKYWTMSVKPTASRSKSFEENHRKLIGQINAVKRSFDDDLGVLKSRDRQRIKSICSSISLVSNDRLGRLETDSLSAHTSLCVGAGCHAEGGYWSHFGGSHYEESTWKRGLEPADDTRLDLGSISEPNPKLQFIQCVNLRGVHEWYDPVLWGQCCYRIYSDRYGIDIIDSAGKQELVCKHTK